jgi:two-component system cell cycle sensor histidine kinase/response regulator CckA
MLPTGGGQLRTNTQSAIVTTLATLATPPRILILDDDEAIRTLLEEALQLHGYQTVTAATVTEAEAVLQQYGAAGLALVISDIHLSPNLQAQEGYVLYQRWTVSYPVLRFLLMSGDPRSQTLPAIRTGQVRFLAKPFSISELLDAVQAILGIP